MKNAFYGLKKKLDTTEERIRKLEKLFQTEIQREKIMKKRSKNCGIVSKNVAHVQLEY